MHWVTSPSGRQLTSVVHKQLGFPWSNGQHFFVWAQDRIQRMPSKDGVPQARSATCGVQHGGKDKKKHTYAPIRVAPPGVGTRSTIL